MKNLGKVRSFREIGQMLFGEEIVIENMQEDDSRVIFYLKIKLNGIEFNSIKDYYFIETDRTVVLCGEKEDIIAEKEGVFLN